MSRKKTRGKDDVLINFKINNKIREKFKLICKILDTDMTEMISQWVKDFVIQYEAHNQHEKHTEEDSDNPAPRE